MSTGFLNASSNGFLTQVFTISQLGVFFTHGLAGQLQSVGVVHESIQASENLDILRPATVLITAVGRIEEAVKLAEYVMAHDPLCEICRSNLIHMYRIAERDGDREEQIRLVLAMHPERMDMYVPLAYVLLLQGDADGAMAALERAEGDAGAGLAALDNAQGLGPSWLMCEAIALHWLERTDEFDIKIRELRNKWGDTWPASVAQVYAAIGDSDQQLATLDFRFTVPL